MKSVADIWRSTLAKVEKRGDVDGVAIVVDDPAAESAAKLVTYAELDARSSRVAQLLISHGLRVGDRVALVMSNRQAADFIAIYIGTHKAGCTFVPLSPKAAVAEWERQIGHCGASLVIAADDVAGHVRKAAGDPIGARSVLTVSELSRALTEMPDHDPRVAVNGDDVAEIIYTSGTTGEPKGVRVTHGSLLALDVSALRGMFFGKTFLHPLPLHTFAGLTYMLWCIRIGMRCVVMQAFDPERFVSLIERERVVQTYAVSSMWLLVLKCVAELQSRDLSSLVLAQFGASPMPPSAVLALCDLLPQAHVMNLYGLTESGTAGCVMPFGGTRERPASVGKPLPTTEVRIADDGEICLRHRSAEPRAYFRDEHATRDAWCDGWLKTGDVGYLDDDGYLFIVDRKKDIIIRGGHNIASLEVEDALYRFDGVVEASVVGVAHEVLGEDVVAFVVPRTSGSCDDAELREFLLSHLSEHKVPRRFEVVASLPRNALGKVLKHELRELASKGT